MYLFYCLKRFKSVILFANIFLYPCTSQGWTFQPYSQLQRWRFVYNASKMSKNARILYFNANILPVIDYCITIWENAPKIHLERIHKLQKRVASVILDSSPDSSSLPLIEKLEWLRIYDRIQYQQDILLYRYKNNTARSNIYSWLIKLPVFWLL